MMKKAISCSLVVALVGTSACVPRGASTGTSLAYLGVGTAATVGGVAIVGAASGGGGAPLAGLSVAPGALFFFGAGVVTAASGLIGLLSQPFTPSDVPRESGPPVPTTDDRVAHWSEVARRMAASQQCEAAARMVALIAERRVGAEVSLRAELRPRCPRIADDVPPSVAD